MSDVEGQFINYFIKNNIIHLNYGNYLGEVLIEDFKFAEEDIDTVFEHLNTNNSKKLEYIEDILQINDEIKFGKKIKPISLTLQHKKTLLQEMSELRNEIKQMRQELKFTQDNAKIKTRKIYFIRYDSKKYLNIDDQILSELNNFILNHSAKINKVRLSYVHKFAKLEVDLELFTEAYFILVRKQKTGFHEKFPDQITQEIKEMKEDIFLGTDVSTDAQKNIFEYYLGIHDLREQIDNKYTSGIPNSQFWQYGKNKLFIDGCVVDDRGHSLVSLYYQEEKNIEKIADPHDRSNARIDKELITKLINM